jgi:hypothetical protein
MKTLPYLKQLTYGSLILAFPIIFSASKDTTPPPAITLPVEKTMDKPVTAPTETRKTIKVTLDSLKQSGVKLLQKI